MLQFVGINTDGVAIRQSPITGALMGRDRFGARVDNFSMTGYAYGKNGRVETTLKPMRVRSTYQLGGRDSAKVLKNVLGLKEAYS